VIPGYWVALTVCGLVLADGALEVFGDRWWVFYFFGQSYSLTDNYNGLAVAWTLSVDVTFYLLLPVFVWLIARLSQRMSWERAAWIVIAPLIVLGPAVRVLNSIDFESHEFVIAIQKIVYAFPGEANFFGIGMGLAVLSVRGRPPWLARRPTLSWSLAAVIYLFTAWCLSFTDPYGDLSFGVRFLANDGLSMAMVILLMLPTVFDERPGPVRTAMGWRPLMFAGIVAYGLYLWHAPLELWLFDNLIGGVLDWALVPRVAVTFAVLLAVSLAVGTLSYYVIELPFLRYKEKRP
jgi:peptidoglycan/LPS O-acetylase OafA/YrhL